MINYKKVDLLHRKNTQDTVLTEEQVTLMQTQDSPSNKQKQRSLFCQFDCLETIACLYNVVRQTELGCVLVGLPQKSKSSKILAGEILENPINNLLTVTGPARVDHQEEKVGFELVKMSVTSMEEDMVDTDMTDMSMVTSAPIWPESSEQDQEMSEISPRKPSQVTEKYFKTLQVPGTSPAAKKDCLLAE